MDGALLGSIDIAVGKARTAALFGLSTQVIGEFAKRGGTSPGFEITNGDIVFFAGGIPIHGRNGRVIGAVGISGGMVKRDLELAQAAVAAAEAHA